MAGLLEPREGAAHAGVFALDDRVDARVLDDREQVVREAAVVEAIEEQLHVGVDFFLFALDYDRNDPVTVTIRGAVPGQREQFGSELGLILEGTELQAAGLVGGEDLVNSEVLFLGRVALDVFGQIDRGALGGRAAFVDPADALGGQLLGSFDADVDAGQRLAVHADQFGDAVEVDAAAERFHDLFATGGLEAEEGFAAVSRLLQDLEAELLPAGDVVDAESLGDAGRGLDELHGCVAGVLRELFRQFEQALVDVFVDFGDRLSGLDEIWVAEASDLHRHLSGEGEVARPLVLGDLTQCSGTTLKVDASVDPGRVGNDAAKLEEGCAVGAVELGKHARRHAEAGRGQFIRVRG